MADRRSKVPQRTYATTLEEQLEQLDTDPLLQRFHASRQQLSGDPHRPVYHYVNPEGNLNDPNGFCYWQGRYHLFYQAYPPEDVRQHWGHACSDDLVHWRDLPLAIYPDPEDKCFSGSTLVEEDRVLACYHGIDEGTMIAVSSDPLLLNWEKLTGKAVIPDVEPDAAGNPYRVGDPCIWREEDGYYSLSGGYVDGPIFEDCRMAEFLFHSQDLERWIYLGRFVENDIFTAPGEDGAVPYFWPIGDRHILLFASHQRGSQYLIGDYDRLRRRFRASGHGRFNFGPLRNGGVHAPSAFPDGDGGILLIHNINQGRDTEGWNHVMSLVRRLTLNPDGSLRVEPAAAIEGQRGEHWGLGETALLPNREFLLPGIEGNALELSLRLAPESARELRIEVLRSPGREEHTSIRYLREGGLAQNPGDYRWKGDALVIDNADSSFSSEVLARPPETAPFQLAEGELLDLRIFIDKSVVELFANGRQAMGLRAYPDRGDSVGVSVTAVGGRASMQSADAWEMRSIYS